MRGKNKTIIKSFSMFPIISKESKRLKKAKES